MVIHLYRYTVQLVLYGTMPPTSIIYAFNDTRTVRSEPPSSRKPQMRKRSHSPPPSSQQAWDESFFRDDDTFKSCDSSGGPAMRNDPFVATKITRRHSCSRSLHFLVLALVPLVLSFQTFKTHQVIILRHCNKTNLPFMM